MVRAPVQRDNPGALAKGLSTVQVHKPCSLTCTLISSVNLAHYRVSHAEEWVVVDCGTTFLDGMQIKQIESYFPSLCLED